MSCQSSRPPSGLYRLATTSTSYEGLGTIVQPCPVVPHQESRYVQGACASPLPLASHASVPSQMIHYMTSNGLGNAWVGNELRLVLGRRIPVRLHALHRPPSTFFESEDMNRLAERANYLYPLAWGSFAYSAATAPLRHRRRFASALWNALSGPRESTVIRAKSLFHLFVAAHLARQLDPKDVALIHSQWIHSGGTVAMYAAWLLDKPFSFTGHAADLFRDRSALYDKIRRAAFIVCISTFHQQFFLERGARPEQLRLAYCGIDTSHFKPKDHTSRGTPPVIVSSGRLVDKKGFRYLIEACGILKSRGLAFKCRIGGSGPLESDLRSRIDQAGLKDVVTLTGKAVSQEELPNFMHAGDIYCLPCVWAADDDVDGLPQMLMEAMACEVPVISTRLVGIPDLVVHEQTGLLAAPNDAVELANHLQRLLEDPELATRLARAGRQRVIDTFDLSNCLDGLVAEYRKYLEQQS